MKILIVEDDFVVRQGIRCSLDWENYGLSVCGDAANGKQGLERVERLEPDIIITDIRMPIMDGLKFAEKVLEENPEAKLIILSGYEDFAYAQQALRLGVYDYLLKPIDAQELLKCVCRLRDDICAKEEKRRYQENIVKPHQTELFDRTMEKLVQPSFPEQKEQVLRELSVIGVQLADPTYKVLLLALENYPLLTDSYSREEKRRLIEQVKEAVKNIFSSACRVWCFTNNSGQFVILLGYEKVSKLYMEDCCLQLMKRVTAELDFLCTISCGLEKHFAEEIHCSCQEAQSALRCHASQIENNVFQYTGERTTDDSGFLEVQEEEKQLIYAIQKYDTGGILSCINAIFNKAVAEQEPYGKVNSTCVRLVSDVFSVLDEMDVKFQNEAYTYQDTLRAIQQYHSVSHLKQYVVSFMKAVSECLEKAERKENSLVVNQAVKYVEKNYKSEISVKNISAEFFITPNYFSQIFKAQMGMNFIDYLNEVRIRHAKELLKDGQLRVYEVAELSGYQNYKYFNTVFKKYTGYSPKEYRNGAV